MTERRKVEMPAPLPENIAIVALGPSAAPLGRRLRAALPGSRLHGPVARPADWDECYDRAGPYIARLFKAGRPIVGLCASGILIRAVAPLLAAKRAEPPVVAVAEDGSAVVPLLGGHQGGNTLARAIAAATGGTAAVTTAGDLVLGIALNELPPGWRIANLDRVKPIMAALLAGEKVALVEEACRADWLRACSIPWAREAKRRVLVTDHAVAGDCEHLVFHPPVLALGIGCERGCGAEEIADLAFSALTEAGLAAGAVAAVVSVERKLAEPGLHALAAKLGVPARFFTAERLLDETGRLTEPSEAAFRATGCWGVAEGAALAAAGADGTLVVPKRKSRRATCAVARASSPIDAGSIGRNRGLLAIVGIGPGDPGWRTPEADAALAQASEVVGYGLYLDLIGDALAGKQRHASPIGTEAERARQALDLAAKGRSVALVSSGDAGVYGLAPLVFELLDRGEKPEWGSVEIVVCPGVSALQAAAARGGAPLGHDFCAISLSDLLTPWAVIQARLKAAAAADFVVALYNPRSARRPHHLARAATVLLHHRMPQTPVFVGRNLGRPGEECRVLDLGDFAAADLDMLSIAIVGNSRTRRLAGNPSRLYTPRGYFR